MGNVDGIGSGVMGITRFWGERKIEQHKKKRLRLYKWDNSLPTTMSHQRLRSDHLQKDYIPVHGPLWGNSHERISCNVFPDFVAFFFYLLSVMNPST